MLYDVNLKGSFYATDETGADNAITIQELKATNELKVLVEGLQKQIDSTITMQGTMTGPVKNTITTLETMTGSVKSTITTLETLLGSVKGLNDSLSSLQSDLIKLKATAQDLSKKIDEATEPGGETPGGNTFNVVDYGAIPNDNKSDLDAFTKTFNAAGNNTVLVPAGTFNLPWTTSSTFDYNRLLTSKGSGRIHIDDFPQPGNRKTGFNPNLINPLYEDGFGRFNMSDVTDDVFMSMNMLHEHRSIMNMYHQNYAAVKTRYNQSDTHPKWVPWGQCALRLDKSSGKLPSGNVTFNIGKFGVMIYRKSTKKWEFEPNPFAAGGGFFFKTYDQTTIALTRTINKAGGYVSFTVPISKTVDYIVHYWTAGWDLKNLTDIQYAIVFCDVWLDKSTPNLEGYFVCNLGLDMKYPNFSNINEFLTGRFIDITYNKRRNFVHNIMEPNYKEVTGGGANINKLIDAKSYSVDY